GKKVVRLLVKEVLVDKDAITIRHSTPAQPPTSPVGGAPLPSNRKLRVGAESYLLRSGSEWTALRCPLPAFFEQPAIKHTGPQVSRMSRRTRWSETRADTAAISRS